MEVTDSWCLASIGVKSPETAKTTHRATRNLIKTNQVGQKSTSENPGPAKMRHRNCSSSPLLFSNLHSIDSLQREVHRIGRKSERGCLDPEDYRLYHFQSHRPTRQLIPFVEDPLC